MEDFKYSYKYPRPAVTTDCVIFGFDNDGLSVLLVQRGIEPYKGHWAFPGGFLNMEEDAETGALRELKEETGLHAERIVQFGTFTQVDRDPRGRVITIAYYALVKKAGVKGGDDAADAQWFPLNTLPPLAFDHDRILRHAMQALKEQIHFKPVGFDLLPEVFTMPQLQYLYECILNIKFDRRNFANKIQKLGLVTPVADGEERKGSRTPIPYRFNEEQYTRMKTHGFRLEF